MFKQPSALTVGFGLFLGSLGIYMVPFQVGALMDGLGLAATQSGFLGTLEIGALSVTTLLLAPLLGRWPLSRVALWGGALAALGELMTATMVSFGTLAAARLLTGIGCGGIYGAVSAAVARTQDPDRLYAQGLALMNLAFLVSFLILPRVLISGGHAALFAALRDARDVVHGEPLALQDLLQVAPVDVDVGVEGLLQ